MIGTAVWFKAWFNSCENDALNVLDSIVYTYAQIKYISSMHLSTIWLIYFIHVK